MMYEKFVDYILYRKIQKIFNFSKTFLFIFLLLSEVQWVQYQLHGKDQMNLFLVQYSRSLTSADFSGRDFTGAFILKYNQNNSIFTAVAQEFIYILWLIMTSLMRISCGFLPD